MRVLKLTTLQAFWEIPEHRDAETPLKEWYNVAIKADWTTPDAIKAKYGNASIVANNRVVFNIGGNKYRLVMSVAYNTGVMFVKFIGTHEEYDKVDVATVELK